MIRFPKISLVPLVCLVGACANSGANYQPVIDGPVGPNYNADLAQCQSLAASQPLADGKTAGSVAVGAGVGAATSAILDDGDNLGEAAAVGALGGLTSSAIQKNAQRESIVRNCMRGRGYNVVG
ncbi:glycine zipper family protein [Ruegeria sediminis]|uniref:Glycine zipper family protein n=1 Tax=Ruegeria sediminis TaxID=2583820 RepID=A0ABY2WVX9_9RHOB|nr:glycine zipper family protein [Ruegeria sediminis]TMV06912.1 glycine zipper family protein [Ruegeria sediminis]